VNAGAGIARRGLTINSPGGANGIDYQSARGHLDNMIVTGFTLTGTSAGVRASLAAAEISTSGTRRCATIRSASSE
jgi:hypothetical protein